MRYRLKHENGTLVENHPGFNSKSEAEAWFQEHLRLLGGLDWRVGFLVKAKYDTPIQLVWSKTQKPVMP